MTFLDVFGLGLRATTGREFRFQVVDCQKNFSHVKNLHFASLKKLQISQKIILARLLRSVLWFAILCCKGENMKYDLTVWCQGCLKNVERIYSLELNNPLESNDSKNHAIDP
jgi:hypothetical protein